MLLAARIDGQPATGLPLDDRGLAYGDGLFETIRVARGKMPLLDRHLARLLQGGARLGLSFDESILRTEVASFLAEEAAGIASRDCDGYTLKIIVTRGSTGRGYRPQPGAIARRILLLFPFVSQPPAHARDGIALYACRHRLAINPALAGLKHLNRLEQVIARAEWSDDVHAEGLLCDGEGRPVEGTMSNLFVVRGPSLQTPLLTRCGVAGVMRAWLLERAAAFSLDVSERDLSRDDLHDADELFMCNSQIGIWPVRAFEGRNFVPGPVTRRLQAAVDGLWEA